MYQLGNCNKFSLPVCSKIMKHSSIFQKINYLEKEEVYVCMLENGNLSLHKILCIQLSYLGFVFLVRNNIQHRTLV